MSVVLKILVKSMSKDFFQLLHIVCYLVNVCFQHERFQVIPVDLMLTNIEARIIDVRLYIHSASSPVRLPMSGENVLPWKLVFRMCASTFHIGQQCTRLPDFLSSAACTYDVVKHRKEQSLNSYDLRFLTKKNHISRLKVNLHCS